MADVTKATKRRDVYLKREDSSEHEWIDPSPFFCDHGFTGFVADDGAKDSKRAQALLKISDVIGR